MSLLRGCFINSAQLSKYPWPSHLFQSWFFFLQKKSTLVRQEHLCCVGHFFSQQNSGDATATVSTLRSFLWFSGFAPEFRKKNCWECLSSSFTASFPNRNLVGAGVGHVEEDSITAWWFRNRRSPVDMVNLSHYLHGFFGGIIIWGLTSWEISRNFLLCKHGVCQLFLWNWHGPMADPQDFWLDSGRYPLALFFKHDSSCWDVVGFPSLSCFWVGWSLGRG